MRRPIAFYRRDERLKSERISSLGRGGTIVAYGVTFIVTD